MLMIKSEGADIRVLAGWGKCPRARADASRAREAAWPRPTDHDRVWWVHRPTNMAPEDRSRREMALVMARRSSALLLLLLAVFWC